MDVFGDEVHEHQSKGVRARVVELGHALEVHAPDGVGNSRLAGGASVRTFPVG